MKKKLTVSGNGLDICIPKHALKLLSYNPVETKLLLTLKDNVLVIEPIELSQIDKYKDSLVKTLN